MIDQIEALRDTSIGGHEKEELMNFQAEWLAIFMQLGAMNGQDILTYTAPNIGKEGIYHGQRYVLNEANALPDIFIKEGIPGIYVVGLTGVELGVASLLGDFDKDHLKGIPIGTRDFFLLVYTVLEMEAIHSWGKYGLGPPERQWEFIHISFN